MKKKRNEVIKKYLSQLINQKVLIGLIPHREAELLSGTFFSPIGQVKNPLFKMFNGLRGDWERPAYQASDTTGLRCLRSSR